MQLLMRLKTILQSKKFYILLISLTIICTFYNCLNIKEYKKDELTLTGTVTKIDKTDTKISYTVKDTLINYYGELDTIKLGDEVTFIGFYKEIKTNSVFNLFNYKNYLLSQKIYYLFEANNYKINKNDSFLYYFKNRIDEYLSSFKSKDYLRTFLIGENDIEDVYKTSFQKNGISHLFAISGLHITLFTLILNKFLQLFIKKEKKIYIIITLFLMFYMFLTNFTPSVIRGSFIFILQGLNKILKLNIKTIYILFLIFCCLLLDNPYAIYNIGFQFTFIISSFLIMSQKIIKKFKNYFVKLFVISLISFLASIPVLINNFFEINLLTPFINLIFVPFVSIIIFPLSLLTLLIKPLDNILYLLVNLLEQVSYFISENISFNIILKDLNYIFYMMYYILISYILYSFYKRKYYKIIYLIIILIVHNNINYIDKYPLMTMIDVGQGDSILLKLPYNKGNILVDTGGLYYDNYSIAESKTIPYLKSLGIKKIDYLILTHGDNDHIKESTYLYNNFKVGTTILNSGNNNQIEQNIIDTKKHLQFSKNILNVNGYKFYFLNEKNKKNENDDSLIIYTNLNNYNILLMGDASKSNENYLLNEYNLGKMHILKVGHHGSYSSSSLSFIDKIRPEISLISAGSNNIYGHPHKQVLENLKNSQIYVTKEKGSVNLLLKDKIKISTCFP